MKSDGGSTRQLWLVPGSGHDQSTLVAEVAVRFRTFRTYTFSVPESLQDTLRPGSFVRVPYGRGARPVDGFCLRVSRQPWHHTLKDVLTADPPTFELPAGLTRLGLWISEYYFCPPGRTFGMLLPEALRAAGPRRTRMVIRLTSEERTPSDPGDSSTDRSTSAPTAKQRAVLEQLTDGPLPLKELLSRASVTRSVVDRLEQRREVRLYDAEIAPQSAPSRFVESPEDHHSLTDEQQRALDAIIDATQTDGFRPTLLFGLPGSGKTEVYVRAVRAVIRQSRQAIILVPEIALATQMMDRLARRFDRVAVLHSGLTARARADALRTIAGGGADVVIGTRSAIFAPCPRLGLIVVDEEQESSFKNLGAPFFHARDVAVKRAQIEDIPLVLGTATPSLETWHNVERGRYDKLTLTKRVPGARLPRVALVQRGLDSPSGEPSLLSMELRDCVVDALRDNAQVILLHNRRGQAAFVRCHRCNLPLCCPRCGLHLVLHRAGALLKCHRCDHREPMPEHCPDPQCRGPLRQRGLAIQHLEEELHALVPRTRLLRLDSDTMKRQTDYEHALRDFAQGNADVLLGTQMIAKGLDFPRVQLVGVIDADAALALPDFRAGEWAFQLLVQVLGRAGRQQGDSLALVQTADEPSSVIEDAVRMDYVAFASREMTYRRRYAYPPITRLARIVVADERPQVAERESERICRKLSERATTLSADIRIDPPSACPHYRLRGRIRWQFTIRAPLDGSLQRLLHAAAESDALRTTAERTTIDVDALDFT